MVLAHGAIAQNNNINITVNKIDTLADMFLIINHGIEVFKKSIQLCP